MIGDFDVSMSSQTVEFKPRNPHEAEAFFRPDRINGLMSDLTEVAAMAYGSGIGEGPSGGDRAQALAASMDRMFAGMKDLYHEHRCKVV